MSADMRFHSHSHGGYYKVDEAQGQYQGGIRAWLRRLLLIASRRPFTTVIVMLAAIVVATNLREIADQDAVAIRQQQTRYLYFLVPTSHADTELCKTVMTAQILGYPPPYLIHWDPTLDYPDRSSLRHLEKLRKTRDFLQRLPEHAQEGMVVLLDGHNSWFQLRPDVLLGRYFKVVEEANWRLYDLLPHDIIAEDNLEPRIVFSAQDHCIPGTEDLPSCQAVPQVPSAQKSQNLRWLNTGVAIGPVRDMLALYQRAVAKAEKLDSGVNSHEVMSEIFGEQELQHKVIRPQRMGRWQKGQQWVEERLGRAKAAGDAVVGDVGYKEGAPDEFGITLDYANELGLSMASSIDKIAWSKHHDRVPADIAQSMPPYWTVSGSGVPLNDTWPDINLLTDHRSGSVPAIINFNYGGDNAQNLHHTWWQNLWLQPYARRLYDSAAMMPYLPAASVLDGAGAEHTFWPSRMTMEKAGVRSMDDTWIGYDQLCSDDSTAQEVFGDGLGPWNNPAP